MAKSKKQQILDMHAENPDLQPRELAFRAKCTHAYAIAVVCVFGADMAMAKPEVLHVNLPMAGTDVQIHCNGKTIGTVSLTKDGLLFLSPRTKKRPKKYIPWRAIRALQELALDWQDK